MSPEEQKTKTPPVVANPYPSPVTPNPQPQPSNNSQDSLTYLALGDSYTIGQSVPESDRWSVRLVNKLSLKNIKIEKLDIIARTGWTTSELSSAIKFSGNNNKYSLVSLLIGVNNQYRGLSLESFRQEFRELLITSTHFANGDKSKVFVLSIPDWGVTPFASTYDRSKISQQIAAFNSVVKEECEADSITFIDITPLSMKALNDSSMVASDGLHFSGKMHDLWAAEALPAVVEKLKQ